MLRIASFSGEIPRLIPRLLPENFAQHAYNTKLENGALTPIRRGRFVVRLPEISRTIHLYRDEWLSWPGYVDVVPGPIADDRLYITGDGPPKILVDGETLPLAVPRPTQALTLQREGELNPDYISYVIYTYTWVTELDEESEPAPLSEALLWSEGNDIGVSGFATPPAGRRINRMRIYRSQTSSAGETQLFFVHERAASQTDIFVHQYGGYPNQEPIRSLNYHSPPDGLRGIKAMPNGIMVGYAGKRVYFSEPYRPHAWPEQYVLTTDYDIVGLGVFGSAVAIMTEGQPYVASGITPDAMAMERLRVNLPCVSREGIADLGYAVAYPSHEGLVIVSQDGAHVVSKLLITRDQWLQMNPYSFVGGSYSGRYMCSYAYADLDGSERRGIMIFDLTGEQPFIVRANDDCDAMFNEPGSGALYLLRNGQDIWEWDAVSEPYGEQLWRSKRYVLPGHTNFTTILIEGGNITTEAQYQTLIDRANAVREKNRELIDTGKTGGPIGNAAMGLLAIGGSWLDPSAADAPECIVDVFADGELVDSVNIINTPVRLKGGFLATTWEIEVRGTLEVAAISLAGSPSELASGGVS